jgi:Ni,Fe-hydrogenase III small subunit/formate hydrogenlyase subunit 6/NADH:ubiquinone oxidoreductase subunit I
MFVFDTLTHRLKRGCETMGYPQEPPAPLPDRHGGALRVDAAQCTDGCRDCIDVCPTGAIARTPAGPITLDLGKCIFCQACVTACPPGVITHTNDHRMAVTRREDLLLGALGQEEVRLGKALDEKLRKLFGRSLRLRVVSAGGCGGCEADVNVLGTIGWDLSRFGIQYVASPRHADGVLVTGCVSKNMSLALRKTYDAVPDPKIVIAVGACAINGGPFIGNPEILNGADSILPVDLYIPGCPPHPLTILDGLLRLLGRLENGDRKPAASASR